MVVGSAAPQAGALPEVLSASIVSSIVSVIVMGGAVVSVMAGSTVSGPTPYSEVVWFQYWVVLSSCRKAWTSLAEGSLEYRMGSTLGAGRTGPPTLMTCGSVA